MHGRKGIARPDFLAQTAGSLAGLAASPAIVPVSILGQGGSPAPSDKVGIGCIGVGLRGQALLDGLLNETACRVVAVSDVHRDHLTGAKATVDQHYQTRGCKAYADFRELAGRPEVDAVVIAAPDHWHVLIALAAVRAGKDLYLEKPMGLSLEESQVLSREVTRLGRVFQFGTQQRSDLNFFKACELVRSGRIGALRHVNVWAPGSVPGGSTKKSPPPPGLDYDFWLGPAPWREHTEDLTLSKTWFFVRDFSRGYIANWGVHSMDIALWGAGEKGGGKVEIQGRGVIPHRGACDTATSWDVDYRFQSGLTLKFAASPYDAQKEKFAYEAEWRARYRGLRTHGVAFEGADGWIRVDRGSIVTQPEELAELSWTDTATLLPKSPNHLRNFLEAVRSRRPTVSPIGESVRSDALCQLADIAIRLGRKLVCDPSTGIVLEDKEARQYGAVRPLRPPWRL